jgi:hypothetical protein
MESPGAVENLNTANGYSIWKKAMGSHNGGKVAKMLSSWDRNTEHRQSLPESGHAL